MQACIPWLLCLTSHWDAWHLVLQSVDRMVDRANNHGTVPYAQQLASQPQQLAWMHRPAEHSLAQLRSGLPKCLASHLNLNNSQ